MPALSTHVLIPGLLLIVLVVAATRLSFVSTRCDGVLQGHWSFHSYGEVNEARFQCDGTATVGEHRFTYIVDDSVEPHRIDLVDLEDGTHFAAIFGRVAGRPDLAFTLRTQQEGRPTRLVPTDSRLFRDPEAAHAAAAAFQARLRAFAARVPP